MKTVLSILLMGVLLTACNQDAVLPENDTAKAMGDASVNTLSETERLNLWFDERNEEALLKSPMTLTRLGRKELYDEIDDASEAAADERLQWRAQTVEDLRANFDYDALTDAAKISYDLWIYQYENALAMEPFRRNAYIFDQMNGSHASLPNFLINMHRVASEEDMQAYITRIGGIARRIDQLLERAQLGAEQSVRPPRFAYEFVLQQSADIVSGAPFEADAENDSPLWADARAKIEGLLETGEIDETKALELMSQVQVALLESLEPSYQSLINWMQDDFANTDEEAQGVIAQENGEQYYNARLASMTTTNLSADEIHELGLSEVARIKLEMETIKEQVDFEGSLLEFFDYVKGNSDFLYPNDDEGRQGYIDDSTEFISVMRTKLPDYFGLMPKAELVVKRVEAFREQDGAAQHYQTGSTDGSRPGVYYAHLSDMNSMPKFDMESVAYHEGIPGHHLQLSIQRELEGVPEFRKLAGFTSYSEGWGLYAELLAKEMGGYQDPYKDFGRLNAEIWRAVRLVVDTGIHAKGWTEQQAVDYFTENSSISAGQIRAEVRRYIVMPGQATSYKIGMLKILELRERARSELGEQFDIREFHDTVLGGGALPLTILERVVDEWIAEAKRSI